MNLGLVFKSGDAVLIGVFLCLIAMSITTWVLILLRALSRGTAGESRGYGSNLGSQRLGASRATSEAN